MRTEKLRQGPIRGLFIVRSGPSRPATGSLAHSGPSQASYGIDGILRAISGHYGIDSALRFYKRRKPYINVSMILKSGFVAYFGRLPGAFGNVTKTLVFVTNCADPPRKVGRPESGERRATTRCSRRAECFAGVRAGKCAAQGWLASGSRSASVLGTLRLKNTKDGRHTI